MERTHHADRENKGTQEQLEEQHKTVGRNTAAKRES